MLLARRCFDPSDHLHSSIANSNWSLFPSQLSRLIKHDDDYEDSRRIPLARPKWIIVLYSTCVMQSKILWNLRDCVCRWILSNSLLARIIALFWAVARCGYWLSFKDASLSHMFWFPFDGSTLESQQPLESLIRRSNFLVCYSNTDSFWRPKLKKSL